MYDGILDACSRKLVARPTEPGRGDRGLNLLAELAEGADHLLRGLVLRAADQQAQALFEHLLTVASLDKIK